MVAILACGSGSGSTSMEQGYNIEVWDANTMASSLESYAGHDSSILFYAPWCQHCQAFAPVFDRIGQILDAGTRKSDLFMAYFNCEQDDASRQICQDLSITHYPTIAYLSAGPCPQSDPLSRAVLTDTGDLTHDRMCKFMGNWNQGEQVRDFITINRRLSNWYKFDLSVQSTLSSVKRFFGFGSRSYNNQPISMPQSQDSSIDELLAKNSELEMATNQAALLMDELLMSPASTSDAFSTLHSSNLWDSTDDPILRSCVVDLTLDYCSRFLSKLDQEFPNESVENLMAKLSDAEPYCGVFEACFEKDFSPAACRPEKCPFVSNMACAYTSTCLTDSIRAEYMAAM